VVAAARVALERGDVTPTLKWVSPDHEGEVRAVFAQVLVVHQLGPEAQAMADTYFFETLVRIHREGEGALYMGLRPPDTVDPAVTDGGSAQERSVERFATALGNHLEAGVRERFAAAYRATQ